VILTPAQRSKAVADVFFAHQTERPGEPILRSLIETAILDAVAEEREAIAKLLDLDATAWRGGAEHGTIGERTASRFSSYAALLEKHAVAVRARGREQA
jgi:hypothetical protein